MKDLERSAKKAEKEEKLEIAKTKKAIQKGNTEVARIHAENAIRQKNQSLNYLRMSARVDAVASRVQSALTTRKVTQSSEYFSFSWKTPLIASWPLPNFSGRRCKSHGRSYEVNEPRKNLWING